MLKIYPGTSSLVSGSSTRPNIRRSIVLGENFRNFCEIAESFCFGQGCADEKDGDMKIPFFTKWFVRRRSKAATAEDWAKIIQRSAAAEEAVESMESRIYRSEKLLRERLARGE